ncbi:hypothetical protein CEUSTIGMA_g727.t1 [Chlamydomonas eustigma]|uniref:Uncharacterized protein n=1 Tax=Chlamydomonas eustigma TaxID=1157962 RepID=A0A250WR29_9CHLO|nr:hypothetical protein CEUSTIGMA_g727.t1 [Chlamydomonas eustigma]|eukprot:GAX73273.1 hypothetical protein CEUSTIGMA_g727.t1 [Chlamydomonas eustigma]
MSVRRNIAAIGVSDVEASGLGPVHDANNDNFLSAQPFFPLIITKLNGNSMNSVQRSKCTSKISRFSAKQHSANSASRHHKLQLKPALSQCFPHQHGRWMQLEALTIACPASSPWVQASEIDNAAVISRNSSNGHGFIPEHDCTVKPIPCISPPEVTNDNTRSAPLITAHSLCSQRILTHPSPQTIPASATFSRQSEETTMSGRSEKAYQQHATDEFITPNHRSHPALPLSSPASVHGSRSGPVVSDPFQLKAISLCGAPEQVMCKLAEGHARSTESQLDATSLSSPTELLSADSPTPLISTNLVDSSLGNFPETKVDMKLHSFAVPRICSEEQALLPTSPTCRACSDNVQHLCFERETPGTQSLFQLMERSHQETISEVEEKDSSGLDAGNGSSLEKERVSGGKGARKRRGKKRKGRKGSGSGTSQMSASSSGKSNEKVAEGGDKKQLGFPGKGLPERGGKSKSQTPSGTWDAAVVPAYPSPDGIAAVTIQPLAEPCLTTKSSLRGTTPVPPLSMSTQQGGLEGATPHDQQVEQRQHRGPASCSSGDPSLMPRSRSVGRADLRPSVALGRSTGTSGFELGVMAISTIPLSSTPMASRTLPRVKVAQRNLISNLSMMQGHSSGGLGAAAVPADGMNMARPSGEWQEELKRTQERLEAYRRAKEEIAMKAVREEADRRRQAQESRLAQRQAKERHREEIYAVNAVLRMCDQARVDQMLQAANKVATDAASRACSRPSSAVVKNCNAIPYTCGENLGVTSTKILGNGNIETNIGSGYASDSEGDVRELAVEDARRKEFDVFCRNNMMHGV